jgi:hypothetical protein
VGDDGRPLAWEALFRRLMMGDEFAYHLMTLLDGNQGCRTIASQRLHSLRIKWSTDPDVVAWICKSLEFRVNARTKTKQIVAFVAYLVNTDQHVALAEVFRASTMELRWVNSTRLRDAIRPQSQETIRVLSSFLGIAAWAQ